MVDFNPNAGTTEELTTVLESLLEELKGASNPVPAALLVTPNDAESELNLDLFHQVGQDGFFAFWVFGMRNRMDGPIEMYDLKHLPPGLEVAIEVKRTGWGTGAITKYTSDDALLVSEPTDEAGEVITSAVASGEAVMPVADVLALMEVLVGDTEDLMGLALPAEVHDRLSKAVSDGVIELKDSGE